MHYQETKYGFDWGAAKITRCFSDEKKGWVTLRIETPKEDMQIYITRTGKVRVHNKKAIELKPNAPLELQAKRKKGNAAQGQPIRLQMNRIATAPRLIKVED